ncbi:hypothetical protein RHMOL_Rhmol11G0230000 [Rhododendron molle]|uniref:Uncharacterized protein n=1 Tax=Rhododendron molle TaxID=49168 RepID=A0ACC0LVW3_RHOML|nr:hypothetical protein RHMOL_Rhmol11G0230000 [Rhododendron molle]
MCLTDNNFKNLPTGDVVDKLIREWSHHSGFSGTTDSKGRFKTRLFHGDYKVTVTHLNAHGASSQVLSRGFKVGSGNGESKIEVSNVPIVPCRAIFFRAKPCFVSCRTVPVYFIVPWRAVSCRAHAVP